MKIFVTAGDKVSGVSSVAAFSSLLGSQLSQTHLLCDDPAEADVILFPDCHLTGLDWRLDEFATSSIVRKYPRKVAVYDERDTPWCRFPGLYVSMPSKYFHSQWQVPVAYYTVNVPSAPIYQKAPDLLFSFVGSPTARCRSAIYALSHPRSYVEKVDGFVFYDPTSSLFAERKQRFAEVLARSKFVLCPRGTGASSIRLYECLSNGKVPVIIADDWEPPRGPAWATFSIRWPESQISKLPNYLEARESDWDGMAAAARVAFADWWAPGVILDRQLDQLGQLLSWQPRSAFPADGFRDGAWRHAAVAAAKSAARRQLSPVKQAMVNVLRRD